MNQPMNVMPSVSDGFSRRRMLQAAGIGALPLGLPGMVAAGVDGKRGLGRGAAEKSCIFILLCGGPSHLDTWDLKPSAPDTIRGPYQPVASKVPGMQLSELHPRMAQMTQDFCLIRSMTHVGNISNHFDAMHHCLSGQAEAPADAPYMGAILAKVRPNERTIAPYVWLIKCVGDPVFCAPNIGIGGHLGAAYSPLFVGSAANHPAMPTFKAPDELQAAVVAERMQNRRRLLDGLSPSISPSETHRATKDWQDLHHRAFELTSGPEGREPFDLNREPTSVRERYGMHPLGQNLLLARRLVESGVGFVTVNGWTGTAPEGGGGAPSSSWDMHGGEMGMGSAFGSGSYGMGWCLPKLDEALSALLTDLKDRGMLENTLVVVTGEFGRTPVINAPGTNPGRQHWPSCFSAILAGGGIRGGAVYGESDKHAAYVKDRPVRPQDLGATIFHSLGVPLDQRLGKDGFTRPLSTGEPLLDLFG
ncbi:MAG: DUF1501 domain-containing protein [Candidatus Saccharimonas sp.]|nr:DUF1501 domain-containing protein [Planctomycetaceae bacterium]